MLLVTLRGFMGSRLLEVQLIEPGRRVAVCGFDAGEAGRHVTPDKARDYGAMRMTKASMFSS